MSPIQSWGPRRNLAGNKLRVKRCVKPTYFVLPDPKKATLGTRLRYLRRHLDLTIEELAKLTRIGHNVIACLERDETKASQPWVLGRILPFLASRFKEVFSETGGDPYDFLVPPTSFGAWLQNQRMRRCLRQKALAALLGVDRESIRRYEANESKPLPAIRLRLRKVFKLNGELDRYFAIKGRPIIVNIMRL